MPVQRSYPMHLPILPTTATELRLKNGQQIRLLMATVACSTALLSWAWFTHYGLVLTEVVNLCQGSSTSDCWLGLTCMNVLTHTDRQILTSHSLGLQLHLSISFLGCQHSLPHPPHPICGLCWNWGHEVVGVGSSAISLCVIPPHPTYNLGQSWLHMSFFIETDIKSLQHRGVDHQSLLACCLGRKISVHHWIAQKSWVGGMDFGYPIPSCCFFIIY